MDLYTMIYTDFITFCGDHLADVQSLGWDPKHGILATAPGRLEQHRGPRTHRANVGPEHPAELQKMRRAERERESETYQYSIIIINNNDNMGIIWYNNII